MSKTAVQKRPIYVPVWGGCDVLGGGAWAPKPKPSYVPGKGRVKEGEGEGKERGREGEGGSMGLSRDSWQPYSYSK